MIKYFLMRHDRSGEVTSVCARDDGISQLPGIFFSPEDDGFKNLFTIEEISKTEFETLLILFEIDPRTVTPAYIDFWLFSDAVRIA